MAAIDVDPAAVQRLAGELAGIASALDDAAGVLGRTAPVAGGPSLDAAMAAFADAWREGLGRLAAEAEGTVLALQAAADGYRRVEHAVAQACR